MKQLHGFKLWIFTGAEAPHEKFLGEPLNAEAFYVGHQEGREVASGPHRTEAIAQRHAEQMTDTSGT